MTTEFEWDSRKAKSNVIKHGVSFEGTLTVFENPLARIFDDEDHSVMERRERRQTIMKKTSNAKTSARGRMRREYRFDYRKARLNRFAPALKDRTVAVILDPDVAGVFHMSESVNTLLRSVMRALPH